VFRRFDDEAVSVRLLTDDDVDSFAPERAVAAIRRALEAHRDGALLAPVRVSSSDDDEAIVMTAGALRGEYYGFRAYARGNPHGDQVVSLFDRASWRLDALVVGNRLGPRRTGAIGAVAIDVLAAQDSTSVAVIGAGEQAYSQLWALRAVRTPTSVRVYSRSAERRAAFAAACRERLGVAVEASESAEAAVRDAEIVIVATSAREPVIEADWVAPGAHVSTLGAKMVDAHECPMELVHRAAVVATDSPAQLNDYGSTPISTAAGKPAVALSSLTAPGAMVRTAAGAPAGDGDVTLFISVGLAGTEVVFARAMLDAQGSA
jgi:ornithine cyclodeaminase